MLGKSKQRTAQTVTFLPYTEEHMQNTDIAQISGKQNKKAYKCKQALCFVIFLFLLKDFPHYNQILTRHPRAEICQDFLKLLIAGHLPAPARITPLLQKKGNGDRSHYGKPPQKGKLKAP